MNNLIHLKAFFAVLTQFHFMNGFWQMLQNSSLVIILVNGVSIDRQYVKDTFEPQTEAYYGFGVHCSYY